MSWPETSFRSELDPVVRKEVDAFSAVLRGHLSSEHTSDGRHTHVTADDVTITSPEDWLILQWRRPNGVTEVLGRLFHEPLTGGTRGIVLAAVEASQVVIEAPAGSDAATFGVNPGSVGVEQRFLSGMTALGNLRLFGQGAQSVTGADTFVAADATTGPLYSYYVLTPSTAADRTISGIYTNATPGASNLGQRGQVVVLVNGGSNNFIFAHDTTVTSNRRLLLPGGTNLTIGPGGSISFVYDTAADRWRCFAFTGAPAATTLTFSNTGLKILDTGGDHAMTVAVGENFTADRTLSVVLGNAARTLTFSGDPTIDNWFDQSVKVAASPTFANVQVGTTGRVLAKRFEALDTDNSHTLNYTCGEDLSADRTLSVVLNNANRTLTITADASLNQDVRTTAAPSFAGVTNTGVNIQTGKATVTLSAGNNNNVTPTGWSTASVLEVTPDGGGTSVLTGLTARADGTVVRVINVAAPGGANFAAEAESASSTAANRFGAGPSTVTPTAGFSIIYNDTVDRWVNV